MSNSSQGVPACFEAGIDAIRTFFRTHTKRPDKPSPPVGDFGHGNQQPVEWTMDDDGPAYRYKRYYDNLCGCHSNTTGHPRPFIPIPNLIEAVENGCSICSVVKHGLWTVLDGAVDTNYSFSFAVKPNGAFTIKYMRDKEWGTKQKFEMYLARGQQKLNPPLDNMGNFREIHPDPLSDSGIERMKELLESCVISHPQCCPPSDAHLPSRVIDIGDEGTNPRLYISEGDNQKYAALSHCWGPSQLLTTERATIQDRQTSISWQDLPKTFQDAMKICHTLGIRYIWIDSLCIIQDDREDWEIESAKMGSVYHNAYLTIAASLSPGSDEGFLSTRVDHISKEFTVSHHDFPGGSARFKIRVAPSKHQRHDIPSRVRDSYRANLIGPAGPMEPLDYRSWAFQEKLIARRLLSFCSKEMEWDCLRCCDCECGEKFRRFWSDGWDFRNASARQSYQGLIDVAEGYTEENDIEGLEKWKRFVYQQWRMSIVPSYTQLRLTKEMDRLPALSAVAQGLESLLNDTYLCGHWKSDLEESLAWSSGALDNNPPSPGRLPERYRAPSWSWASIEGPVDTCFEYEDDYEPIFKVLDAGITPAGRNVRADARDGFIRVSGYLVPGMMTGTVVQIDGSQTSYRSFHPDTLFERGKGTIQRSRSSPMDGTLEEPTPVQLLAVLIARPRTNVGFGKETVHRKTSDLEAERWIAFLALTPSLDQDGAYERLGIFKRISSTTLPQKWYETWPKSEVVLV